MNAEHKLGTSPEVGPPENSVLRSLRTWSPTDLDSLPLDSSAREASASEPLTVVLIHGSMDRQSGFRRLAKSLSQRHRVLTYDRRGYAASADLPGPFTMENHVRDLSEIIESRPSVLVGHSYGGALALAFAARSPFLVRGVVVYESPMSWETWWASDSGGAQAVALSHDPEAAAEAFLVRFIGERLWSRLPETTKRARRAEGRALVGELSDLRLRPAWRIEDISVPVVSGYGTRARPYVQRAARFIASAGDARLVELEGAHHNAHSAEPKVFEDLLVRPLLDRVVTGRWSE